MSDSTNTISSFAKLSARKLMATTAMTAAGFLMFSGAAKAADDFSDHTYAGGSAGSSLAVTVDIPNSTTNIEAVGSVVKVSGDGDLKANWTANINQDNSSAKYVLFDNETDPTHILGQLNANGQVFIFDKDGVIFGADSVVNVGGILASSGNLASDVAQLDAGNIIINSVDTDGAVRANGTINVMTPENGGFAAFVAPTAVNHGVINARLNNVVMAAGETVTLDLYGDGLVEVAVDGELGEGLLRNTGTINAQGGTVQISAAVAKDAIENVINMDGVTTVSSAVVKGGKIILSGGNSGRVNVKGALNANGVGTQDAGEIEITGKNVRVTSTGRVRANAQDGAAGIIDVIATNDLKVNGQISAQGDEDTGEVETSAPTTSFGVASSVLATREWLLDPTDVVIDSGSTIEGLIESQLTVGDMTVQTPAAGTDAGNIDLNTVIDWGTDNTFGLVADGSVNVNGTGGVNATGAGNFFADAGNKVKIDGDIITQGGTIDIDSTGRIDVDGALVSNGGDIAVDVNTNSLLVVDGEINSGAGDTSLASGTNILIRGDVTADELAVTSGNAVEQTTGSTIVATTLTGNVDKAATFLGSNNDIKNIGDFATGLSPFADGGFTLNNARTGRSYVAGTVSTQGGDIDIDTAGRIDVDGTLVSNGGDIAVDVNTNSLLVVDGEINSGAGDTSLASGTNILIRGDVTADELAVTSGNAIEQTTGSTIVATTLTGNVDKAATFLGLNNDIKNIGDFATGLSPFADGGFTLFDSANGLNVTGILSTQGGDVDLETVGDLTVTSTGKILTNGGNLTAKSDNLFDIDNGAMVMLVDGDAHIDAPLVNLGDDIDTTGSITGTANTVNVENDDAQIQDGVDVSSNGATVNVAAGTFDESVIVNKAVTLLGNNAGLNNVFAARSPESIVTGGSPAFTVTSDNVTIDGFTMDGPTLDYGVKLNDVKGIKILNNIISNSSVAGIGGVIDHDDAVQVDFLVQYNIIGNTNTGDGINLSGDGAGVAANAGALVGSRIDIIDNFIGGSNGVGGSAIVFSKIGDPTGLADVQYGRDVVTETEINVRDNTLKGKVDGVRFDGTVDEANIDISSNGVVGGGTGTGVKFVGDLTNSDVDINENRTLSGRTGGVSFANVGSVGSTTNVDVNGNMTIFSLNGDGVTVAGRTKNATVKVKHNDSIVGGDDAVDFNLAIGNGSMIEVNKNGNVQGGDNGIEFTAVNNSTVDIKENDNIHAKKHGVFFGNLDNNTVVAIEQNSITGDEDANGLGDGVLFQGTVNDTIVDVVANSLVQGVNGVRFAEEVSGNTSIDIVSNDDIAGIDGDGVLFEGDVNNALSPVSQREIFIYDNAITGSENGVRFAGNVSGNGHDQEIALNTITGQGNDGVRYEGTVEEGHVRIVAGNTITGREDGIDFVGAVSNNARVTINNNQSIVGQLDDGIDFHTTLSDATVRINGNHNILGDGGGAANSPSGGNGIEFAAIDDSTVEIKENNAGIRGDDHGIFVGGAVNGGADIDIHDNIISADENNDGLGDGIHFARAIGTSTINIGDGSSVFQSGASNIIRSGNGGGIVFDAAINENAQIALDGNRLGYSATSVGGALSNDRLNEDGIRFNGDIGGNADISITDSHIRADEDGIRFDNTIGGNAVIVVGGMPGGFDGNVVDSNDDGIQFGTLNGNASVEVSHNTVTADDSALRFGSVSNADVTAPFSEELLIANNTLTGGDHGIRFTGSVSGFRHDTRITGNTIDGQSENGIVFEGVIDDAEIRITDNTSIVGDNDGIHFGGEVRNNALVEIIGNDFIEGEDDDGIDFASNILNGSVVRINENSSIRADENADNGIEFAGVNNATVEILDNNHGIHADGHGIYFGGAVHSGADIDIHGNIIAADENNNGNGDGIHFNSDIYTATINIGDGNGASFGSSPSNFIRGVDGIHFAGELNSGTEVVIDGNRIGYGKRTNGSTYSDAVNDDGIQFDQDIQGRADVKITDNWINSDDDSINFGDDIQDDSRVLIGGSSDGNTIFAGNEGVQIEGDVKDHSLLEISHNEIEADDNGIQFNGETSNHLHSGHAEEILIAHNSIEAGENGILFEGEAGNELHDIMIRDNTKIHGHDGDGIRHEGGIDDAELTIKDNDDVFGDVDAIHIEGEFRNDAKILIDNNTDIDSEDGDGIEVTQFGGARGVDLDITNNHVHNTGDNGIEVENVDNILIEGNTIHNAGNDGINVDGGENALIEDNTIQGEDGTGVLSVGNNGADRDGIHVEDNNGATIVNNHILGGDGTGFLTSGGAGAGRYGIYVDDSSRANINDNNIEAGSGNAFSIGGAGASDDGIHVEDSRGTDVFGNLVDGVGGDGIDVDDSRDTEIGFNRVRVTGDNGIQVTDSRDTDIFGNIVSLTGGNGIDVHDSRGVDIFFNGVFLTSDDGIHVGDSRGADVSYNLVSLTGEDGIDVHDSNWSDVNNNFVFLTDENGISVRNSDNADIMDNNVQFVGENGIYVNPSDNVEITGNTIDDVADDAIDVNGGRNILIDGNFIGTMSGNIGDDGIDVDGSSDVTISNNQITAASEAGIELTDTDVVNILFNDIFENDAFGVSASGSDNTSVILSGNTFTNNDIHAQFESGEIDLTGTGNSFTGGTIGLRFAPFDLGGGTFADMSLVGNTIGSQTFDGQDLYVELDNGAFFAPGTPTILDATDSTFVTGTGLGTIGPQVFYTSDQIAFLESKFTHFNDNGSTGQFFFPQLADIDQEDIFQFFSANAGGLSGLNVTLAGLPTIPGAPGTGGTAAASGFSPASLNNITPAAGGDGGGLTPEELNALETAAGGEEASSTTCWGDAMSATGSGAPVNFSYGSGAEGLLNSEASCGS